MRWLLQTGALLIAIAVGGASTTSSTSTNTRTRTDTSACETCHAAETAEWETSRHAAAWRDPIFQAEFAHGRQAWCVGCHAPEAPDATAVSDDDPLAARGVACAGCHTRGERMVSARRTATSPHDTVADPSFGSPDFCARCHEFNFPVLGPHGRLERYTDEPMQATVTQWRKSGIALECADCHGAGHAFPGSHDVDLVAGAIDLAACRTGGALVIDVSNRGAAHNVPSGGVNRHMVVRAWRSSAPERLVDATIGRRFRPLHGGGKQTTADTTIPPGATRRTLVPLARLGGSPAEPINVELRYVYALDELADLPGAVISRIIHHRRIAPGDLVLCN